MSFLTRARGRNFQCLLDCHPGTAHCHLANRVKWCNSLCDQNSELALRLSPWFFRDRESLFGQFNICYLDHFCISMRIADGWQQKKIFINDSNIQMFFAGQIQFSAIGIEEILPIFAKRIAISNTRYHSCFSLYVYIYSFVLLHKQR